MSTETPAKRAARLTAEREAAQERERVALVEATGDRLRKTFERAAKCDLVRLAEAVDKACGGGRVTTMSIGDRPPVDDAARFVTLLAEALDQREATAPTTPRRDGRGSDKGNSVNRAAS